MAVPPQLILAAMQMMKNKKSTKDQIKEALAPATDALKNDISPLVSMSAKAGTMYNLRAEDPSMRTGIATGAIGGAADGFQAGGLGGLFTGGILGGLGGAIATGNAKEQKEEQGKYTYLNQMYGSVVGEDYNLQSLLYAEEGGEIISPEGEVFVPIQTEAKKIGNKLVKEKLIFSDGKIADVNATKPHSEQKKDDVTDITVEGTYVMPVSTKLSKKDLDSLINYSTSNYSENGKNFGVEKITLRNILGDDFEGSFAEATDIVTKKYPVADNEDDLDPIARVTNNENIANRSKIIAHLMRLNEAKINKEPIVEEKLMPDMKAKIGGFVKKYVLGSTVSAGNPIKPKTALEKRKDKYDQNKPKPVNKYTLKAYEPESKAKKIYKALVAPVSTMDNRSDTSYEDPNGLDIAIGVINPFAWIDGAATVLKSTKDIVTGEGQGNDYTTVGLSAAGAALGLRGSGAKRVGDKISKFMNNMYNPAAGVSLKKVDVPTPTNNIETPEGFQNRVFDSNVQLGQYSGKGHLSEAGYNYRVLSPAEIDAIAETRGVFPRSGKQKGGNENTKYWTKGNEKNWYGDKANQETIRVKQDRFINDKVVLADDVEVFNKQTGKFEPLSAIRPTPKMSKGGFVSQYVLKPSMSLKKGGYINKYEDGGGIGDPPGKKYKNKNAVIIVGDDNKYYWQNQDGSYKEADKLIIDQFNKDMSSNGPSGSVNTWQLTEQVKPDTNNGTLNIKEKRQTENILPLPVNSIDPIKSTGYIEPILGSYRTTSSITNMLKEFGRNTNTENKQRPSITGRPYLIQKANQNLTPTDLYSDVVNTLPSPNTSVVSTTNTSAIIDTPKIKIDDNNTPKEKWKDELLTKRWQQRLKASGLYQDGEVDGIWGKKTQAAYEAYQKNKLKPTSLVKKMKKGGYIRKMAIGGFNGGPTVPIIPEKWRDIWAIDETGQAPYYQMPTMAENPFYNMSPIDKISNGLPVTDENPYGFNGQTAPIPNGATPSSRINPTGKTNINPGETEMLDEIKGMISERSGDAIRDAEESKKGYKDLSRRVGMRDLMQLGNSLIGIGLQDRSERRSFKRPLYIDQKYRGLSPQQINQESEAATGAGVEMVKNMLNAGGDRVTARLAPILVEKLISQQGRNRKAYVDQNTQLERSKYDERGAIQQFNLDEEQRASRVEQDNTNKAIAGTSNVFNKYISSRSDADISKFKVDEGINRDLTDKLYKLDDQRFQADIIGKDYEMQMSEINKKIADIEFELNRTDIDAAQKASLKSYQYSYKKMAEDIEKRKINNQIKGK